MIQELTEKDFDKVYQIMEESFPPDERRTYQEQKALLSNSKYSIYVLPDDETKEIKAFLAVWQFDDVAFIEHFAVNPAYRNRGLGSQILQEIKNFLSCMICLEVELPDCEIAKRRIEFYKRNGFFLNEYPYEQPAITKGRKPLPLMIMTSGSEITKDRFDDIKVLLYKCVHQVL